MRAHDEKFFAWLDGELSGAEAAEMEAKVAADPQLAAIADQHRTMQATLKRAFDPIAEAPVPHRLRAALRADEAEIVDFAAVRHARQSTQGWKDVARWPAMAATLAVGIVVGTMVPQRAGAPVEVQGGRMYAAAALDEALDAQLASAPAAGDVRIGVTFRDQAGAICRSFTERRASGLACRDGNRWQVRGLFAAPEGQATDYRMAAGMDPNLAAMIDSTIAGDPFDAAAEQGAKERGWR